MGANGGGYEAEGGEVSTQRLPKERGFVDVAKLPRGPNDLPLCRQCGEETPTRRNTFCGPACVDAWKTKTDPGHQRRKVFERDHGVCATCGIDTEMVAEWLRGIFHVVSEVSWRGVARGQLVPRWIDGERREVKMTDADVHFADEEVHYERWGTFDARDGDGYGSLRVTRQRAPEEARGQILELLRALEPYRRGTGHNYNLWDMDHIVPVIEGGGACGLENLRTLCIPCHKAETRALAARRAQKRRASR